MKRFICILIALCSILCCCSCGSEESAGAGKYTIPQSIGIAQSGTVAENSAFSLSWDSRVGNLILFEKSTGAIWSSAPYDYYFGKVQTSDFADSKLYSTITIKYTVSGDNTVLEKSSYDDVLLKNTAYSLKIKNGIRVIYFFDDVKISVPVDYTLTEKGLKAEVLVGEITEGEGSKLYSVSLLPYFASARNNTDSYLFVPSGSGALIYTDDNKREERSYSEGVYGDDLSKNVTYSLNREQQIYMPVFGAKAEDSGLMGIITSGAELATIKANAGNAMLGYSSVWPTFDLRGSDTALLKDVNNRNVTIEKLSTSVVDTEKVSVEYTVLGKEKNSYIGMAGVYRNYLKETGALNAAEKNEILYLDILGAAKVKKSLLGIAYSSIAPITTLEQAAEILKDVKSYTNKDVVASLKGFGTGGLDYSSVGGGFKIAGQLGNNKQLKALNSDDSMRLIMDFDILRFNKSGSGVNTLGDYARGVNNTAATSKSYNLVTHDEDTTAESPYLLKRSKVADVGEKLIKSAQKLSLNGVSLSDFGKIAYGDSNDNKYLAKNETEKERLTVINNLKKNNYSVALESANAYAAVTADWVYNVPSGSSKYLSLDKDVPFYQVVLKGNVAIYSQPINLAADSRQELLRAISTGTALYFTVGAEYNGRFNSSVNNGIAGSIYTDIKDTVKDSYTETEKFLKAVKGSEISDYSENNGVIKTVFANSVTVWVNLNKTSVKTPLGVLEAESFIYE